MVKKLVRKFIHLSFFIIPFFCSAQNADSVSVPQNDTSAKVIGDIIIIGNKITKNNIITRELTFRKGDTIAPNHFDRRKLRSEQNIFNTSLFNSVHITSLTAESGLTSIYIIVTERWYIFPVPIFEIIDRNINVWLSESAHDRLARIVYGGAIMWYNFRGRNETVDVEVRTGYTQRINLSYSVPYINHEQNAGLNFHFAYSQTHQTNYATLLNNPVYYEDTINFSIKGVTGTVEYTYRSGLYNTHYADAGYVYAETEDTIQKLNPDFFASRKMNERYFYLRYFYKSEHRDYIAYPLHGYEYNIEAVRNGLPFLNNDVGFSYLTFDYRKFWQLFKSSSSQQQDAALPNAIADRSFLSRWYFGIRLRGKVSDNNFQPYFNVRALGYSNDYVRGYEYYITDGQNFGLVKTNLKFELLRKHEYHAGFIPLEKFSTIPFSLYLNLFGDAAYSQDKEFPNTNSLTNSWLIGYGAGIDLLTYYDIVFRIEYSFNKLGQSGFFLHFSAPI
jgi:outer membrane protein assembly factor BamA